MPISELVTATAAVDAMGDKVAAAVIAQNLVWVLASLNSELDIHVKRGGSLFINVFIAAGFIYVIAEGIPRASRL